MERETNEKLCDVSEKRNSLVYSDCQLNTEKLLLQMISVEERVEETNAPEPRLK